MADEGINQGGFATLGTAQHRHAKEFLGGSEEGWKGGRASLEGLRVHTATEGRNGIHFS